ncbi:hypothetical protein GA0116948_101512 [Chitinophaga costaii]|uniref:Uncharacterized protein n=1 Tax=Chitinophaga costaii TaxID=1335309 RepID=A0A1C3ZQP6_9BACT|nr:hypothetical protein [Chitinophaga costaii]PUZ30467.1 hypothetical protein DCM91_03105 [Chitinophaga costaii]SCB84729.1 hypothetical protein GA0116948_101512 [Chitinophaga costaii]
MKNKLYILKTVLFSCFLVGFIGLAEVKAASIGMDLPGDSNKDKDKAAKKVTVSEAYKSNLALDAGFRFSGVIKPEFNLTPVPNNIKPTFTYKQGNATYLIPYSLEVPQQPTMNYHRLQITFPFKKG